RFGRPVVSLYRLVLPFVGILVVGLGLVSYVPWLSNVAVAADVAGARRKAERDGVPPRDAWLMECVQEDPADPQPCSEADRARYAGAQAKPAALGPAGGANPDDEPPAAPAGECNPDFDDCSDAGARR
ncbi:MAG TPA: hypothetical protein VE987_00750, partial [Polyangiaceae bacterium]|nr:hypothetical protein [Polyangiaceae bacterium]